MKVVGDVLRIPAAISFVPTDAVVVFGLTRSMTAAALATNGARARSRKRASSLPVTWLTRP